MPSMHSFEAAPGRILASLGVLERELGCDAFLCRDPDSGEIRLAAGLAPRAKLDIDQTTDRQQMAAFCFGDGRPTFGFLSYEYGLRLHGMAPSTPTSFPLGALRKYETHLYYRSFDGRLEIDGPHGTEVRRILDAAEPAGALPMIGPARPSLEREGYERCVDQALERIRDGLAYQLTLSIRFDAEAKGLDAAGLFTDLFRSHPASHYALFAAGERRIVSASPERFLRACDGEVLSQPIKGTMRAAKMHPELVRRLTSSPKEDAELSMIVDLIRNDVSANCDYGTVRVHNHKTVFQVDDLLQMRSDVTGRLRKSATVLDLLLDAFPGGSVTGCPKKSALQIMDELEPHARGIYCGSLFMIFDEKNFDSSVAIRTASIDRAAEKLTFHAGSGIVVDSEPGREYQETMDKAGKFLAMTGGRK